MPLIISVKSQDLSWSHVCSNRLLHLTAAEPGKHTILQPFTPISDQCLLNVFVLWFKKIINEIDDIILGLNADSSSL